MIHMSLLPATPLPPFQRGSSQLILVSGEGDSPSAAKVYVLEKRQDRWYLAFAPMDATVGRNGFASPGVKKEGDGRTPSGVYPLPLVFGYKEGVTTRMPYRRATEKDIWVDDPDAPDYNSWVSEGDTRAASFERMRRGDDLYKIGIVIGYNMNPVVRGKGSAIFVHLWKNPGVATSGCVAVREKDISTLIEWLDPLKNPRIAMGRAEALSAILR